MTLKFYTNPMSRGQIARWALHEAGAEYDQRLLEYGTTMKADDYLKINPMGKVPAIDHDGKIVTEGAAICAFPLAVFCRGPGRGGDHQPVVRLRSGPGQGNDGWLWQL